MTPPSPKRGDTKPTPVHLDTAYGRYAGLGLQFALTIGLFAWGGNWLDGKLGTRPILLIAGVLLGFMGALISLIRRVPPSRSRRRGTKPTANE